jgi:putative ABC transport system permease protein
MSTWTTLIEAFISLSKNKVRTGLSVLGIVIGIASVIAMVAVGEGARTRVEREIEALGDDWIMIGFWGIQRGGARKQQGIEPNLAADDAASIARDCRTIRAATPSNRLDIQVVSPYGNFQTTVQGVHPSYFDIRRWKTVEGDPFTEEDMRLLRRVCCIGQSAAREIFGGLPPVGQQVRIKNVPFEIIGLLEAKGNDGSGRDNDDVILCPWDTFQKQVAGNEVSRHLFAAAMPGVPLSAAKEDIRRLLRQRHKLDEEEDDDFRIIDRTLAAQATAEATKTFNLLLTIIASISLLVGGVGIMNITLVSVTERTREIGMRMAIGANSANILGQFLTEAVLLCVIGGLCGFLGGTIVAHVSAHYLQWEVVISTWMAGVAVAFATAIGLFFGFYPAWRASRLDPIEALRFE